MAKAKTSTKAPVKAKAKPKKAAAAKPAPKKAAKTVAEKKKASSKVETRRPAPAVPSAGNAARPETRIPAAREKSAASTPIKLPSPPRSGVVRPRTHYAETPVAPTRRK
jgi:hypothetical protein